MAKTKSAIKSGVALLDRSPNHLLHRALQRALDIYAEEFGEGGITQRQFAVLAASEARDGATVLGDEQALTLFGPAPVEQPSGRERIVRTPAGEALHDTLVD